MGNDRDELGPQVVFYLKHRETIDEWIKLPEQEKEAADAFFKTLADPIVELAQELPGSVEAHVNLDVAYRKLLLCRPGWRSRDHDGSEPRVAIGIEWCGGKDGLRQAYVGVWVNKPHDPSGQLANAIVGALPEPPAGRPQRRGRWWPASRRITPRDFFWDDLDQFRRDLVEVVAETWDWASPAVDEAIGSIIEA